MLIDELKSKAQKGDSAAQYELGILYSYGDETEYVSLDFKKALKWLRKSAKQKYAPAYNALAIALENGEGTRKNTKKAFIFFNKAADMEDVFALRNLAWRYERGDAVVGEKNLVKSKYFYKKAALIAQKRVKEGDARAQDILAESYYYGYDVEQNYEKAIYWYKKAAEQGYRGSLHSLGICYEYGLGVKKDLEFAVKFYEEAAKKGDGAAQVDLGLCYERGNGIKQDYKEAKAWYEKAAERNDERGQCFLAECYEKGNGIIADIAQAIKLYTISANNGYNRAQYNLAECYRYGKGVKQNLKKAIHWYKKAADQDYWSAKFALDELNKQLSSKPAKKISVFENSEDNEEFFDRKFAEYKRYIKEKIKLEDNDDYNSDIGQDVQPKNSLHFKEEQSESTVADNAKDNLPKITLPSDTDQEQSGCPMSKESIDRVKKILNSVEELKAIFNSFNSKLSAVGISGMPSIVKELEQIFKNKEKDQVKNELQVFLFQKVDKNTSDLDILIVEVLKFFDKQKKSLKNEVTGTLKTLVSDTENKSGIPRDTKEKFNEVIAEIESLIKDIDDAKMFSAVFECRKDFNIIKQKIGGIIPSGTSSKVKPQADQALISIVNNLFAEAIKILEKKRRNPERTLRSFPKECYEHDKASAQIDLYNVAITCLESRNEEFDPDLERGTDFQKRLREDIDKFIKNVGNKIELLESILSKDWKKHLSKIKQYKQEISLYWGDAA